MNYDKNIIEEKIYVGIGEPIIKKYLKGQFLGKGGFSECYEVTKMDNKEKFAIKIINKTNFKLNKNKEKIMSEINIHKILFNKNILNFHHYFEDNHYIYIWLELCEYGSLTNILKNRIRLTEKEIKYYLIQIIDGLKYLHNDNIIHRDINSNNILINKDFKVKISDFGLSTKLRDKNEIKFSICGTPNYLAPEIISGLKLGYSFEIDIWSLGILIYKMCFGILPFDSNIENNIYKKIVNVSFYFPKDVIVSDDLKFLISKLVIYDKNKRLSLNDILKQPFLQNFDFYKYNLKDFNYLKYPPLISTDKIKKYQFKDFMFNKENDSFIINDDSESLDDEKDESYYKNYNESTSLNNKTNNLKRIDSQFTIKLKEKNIDFIVKFIDLTNKYGIGYKLDNGSIGVLFNDNISILKEKDSDDLIIIYKIKFDKIYTKKSYKKNKYPKKIIKKVNLFYNFYSYLNNIDDFDLIEPTDDNTSKSIWLDEKIVSFIKFYNKIDNGYLFTLNNKIIQVIFKDKTEFVFDMNKKKYVYFKDYDNKYYFDKFSNINEYKNDNFINKFSTIKDHIIKE